MPRTSESPGLRTRYWYFLKLPKWFQCQEHDLRSIHVCSAFLGEQGSGLCPLCAISTPAIQPPRKVFLLPLYTFMFNSCWTFQSSAGMPLPFQGSPLPQNFLFCNWRASYSLAVCFLPYPKTVAPALRTAALDSTQQPCLSSHLRSPHSSQGKKLQTPAQYLPKDSTLLKVPPTGTSPT